MTNIDRTKLRVRRLTKFVFLCGGFIQKGGLEPASNLRDFLWRLKNMDALPVDFVLAESAQELYRDSGYRDLISFEEDIARIASVVLVISESAGSLAELGAFCSNPVISPVLRVIVSEEDYAQESFIRWGPIQRILDKDREYVGVFPWLPRASPNVLTASAEPHFDEIFEFIRGHVEKSPATTQYPKNPDTSVFYDILWFLFLADAATPGTILEKVKMVHPDFTQEQLRRKLYALRVARWVDMVSYSNQDYYFLPELIDPYNYAYKVPTDEKELTRRLLTIRDESFSSAPKGAFLRVKEKRALRA